MRNTQCPKQKPESLHCGYYICSIMSNTTTYRRHPYRVSLNLFNLFNCVYISSLFIHMLTCWIVVARRERNESWPTQRWQPLGARRWPLRLHLGPDYTCKRQLSWPKIRVRKASSVPTSLWDGKTSSRPLITMWIEYDIGLTLLDGLDLWNGLDLWIMSM